VADARLNAYLILLAPVLARIDGVTDDPADVEMAEAILVAPESADGIGLTRSEIAARAGVDAEDPRFGAKLESLSRAGALQHLRGDKKHQIRYLPDPDTLLAAEILARVGLWGFQNSTTRLDLGFYAARSYSLMRPPRTGRRLSRSLDRSATHGPRPVRVHCDPEDVHVTAADLHDEQGSTAAAGSPRSPRGS